MFWKKGWIENRRRKTAQDPLMMDYRVVPAAEFLTLTGSPHYAHTSLHHSAIAKLLGQLLQADVPDLFNGNVMICSANSIQQGYHLEAQLFLSDYHCKLKFLAEATVIHMDQEMKEMVFSAGIRVLSVNKEDMDLLNRIIERQK